jgi:hypothetical protein
MIKQRLRSQVPEGAPFSPENLARVILTVCEFLAEIGRQCPPPHGQLEPLMEKQIKAELYQVLRAWLADMPPARSDQGPTLEQAAMVACWAIYGAAVEWTQRERRKPAAEFVQQVLPIIMAGLQPAAELPTISELST